MSAARANATQIRVPVAGLAAPELPAPSGPGGHACSSDALRVVVGWRDLASTVPTVGCWQFLEIPLLEDAGEVKGGKDPVASPAPIRAPEPGTLVLLGTGLVALGAGLLRGRKRRTHKG